MPRDLISSPRNPRVQQAIKLRDRGSRQQAGLTLIDGSREILRAARSGVRVVEAFVCPALCDSADSREVLALLSGDDRAAVWEVTEHVYARVAFGERAEGAVVVAEIPRHDLADLRLPASPLVAVLEGVEKPGNLGAVLRSADGAGVDAVILADGRTDPYNPNAIRASLGTIFSLPVCSAATAEVLSWLRRSRFQIVAARLDAAEPYTSVDLTRPTAIVLGSEASGLTAPWTAADITGIRLPMRGVADSLNVSATAAVLFYEALRQRTVARK